MHKLTLEMFSYLKNFVYFLKICSMFFFMLLILYWIQNIISADWTFLNIFSSILSSIVDFAASISDGKKEILGTVFEIKYIIALLLCTVVYYASQFLYTFVTKLEGTYSNVRDFCIKKEEDFYNNDCCIALQHWSICSICT